MLVCISTWGLPVAAGVAALWSWSLHAPSIGVSSSTSSKVVSFFIGIPLLLIGRRHDIGLDGQMKG
jgi:hypothetical protein